MKISEQGLNEIKFRECNKDAGGKIICPLQAYAATEHEKANNKWTIGFGNTFYASGKPVQKGDKLVNEDAADKLFRSVVALFESEVASLLVGTHLDQGQYDAIISFVYNEGVHNFANSTLLKYLKQGNYLQAGNEFLKWVYQDHKIVPGLVTRRRDERLQFLTGQYHDKHKQST
jgi:lysozyme